MEEKIINQNCEKTLLLEHIINILFFLAVLSKGQNREIFQMRRRHVFASYHVIT